MNVSRHALPFLVVLCLLTGGCSLFADDGSGAASGAASGATEATSDAVRDEPRTVPVDLPAGAQPAAFSPLSFDRVAGEDRVGTALAVSERSRDAAQTVLLARADAFADALAAAPLAAELDAPVLLSPVDVLPGGVLDEIERLGAERVVLLGGEAALAVEIEQAVADAGPSVERIAGSDRYATAAAVAGEVSPSGRMYVVTGTDFPDALAAGAAAARLPAPIVLVDDAVGVDARAVIEEQRPSEIMVVGGEAVVPAAVADELEGPGRTVERLAGENRYGTAAAVHAHVVEDFGGPEGVWLASGADFADALSAGPAVAAEEATLLLTDPVDLSRSVATVEVLGEVGGPVIVAGGPAAVTDQSPRQIRAVLAGNTLPGGATVLFPAHRMVAYYGNADYEVLGVLGETSPEEAVERVEEVAAEYRDGERTVMPAFELIVTIATAAPGADGQYSAVGDLEDVREYVKVAREHGFYLFLDFQPGRNEFIDQVRLFEEFLREPHVGAALDPEWRMAPDERPGQVIGSVDAAEVNVVAEYLAGIVREEDLPQKLLVVHQFRTSMIRDREELATPPELAVTIHVDGFGNQELKLETWGVLAEAEAPWFHGFKLFYDEDTNLFAPGQILEFSDPAIDLITYQ